MKILVVGGAGYIGSHCVKMLLKSTHQPVVVDNLVYGHKAALKEGVPFYNENLGNKEAIKKILKEESIDAVMHFAAYAYVGESVENPLKYYLNNVVATLHLLEAMLEVGVKKFVFSSTCATYGNPKTLPIKEDAPQHPINPYGQTKLDVENALKALAFSDGLSFAALRYFNAAGAAIDGSIGEDHSPETHLIPVIFETLLGKRDHICIFGTDYPTPDGTCLRDYIHVDDLARAHIRALEKLEPSGKQLFINLGTGKPYSVREIIKTIEAVTGKTVLVKEAPRRAGDPPALYADPSLAQKTLGWKPECSDIETIVRTAWTWHATHPNGYAST
jgi:UDP-glucose 4-epimerase